MSSKGLLLCVVGNSDRRLFLGCLDSQAGLRSWSECTLVLYERQERDLRAMAVLLALHLPHEPSWESLDDCPRDSRRDRLSFFGTHGEI